ncbi:chromosome segregation protein SMC [Bifidobacterium imperatoris]|uniref:Chromosome partition protein Smc n=1 Tax=Bifidobacterium imperatoris TaxID=2020965 RepID=A0A2N5ITD2_9BIFI|nr:chromosome segregation protein SMC [Bifidobacterium imperatoris]PLS25223.1 chromosome segregation protein SMC [Bifidobacterium imperatoris]QSY57670.1 chromosome segregation protein SMC [Bifidobacterium imperatoris]
MYLKELTLRGFKSFASATTLRFEPGITAVVGPNGSGKSNIVDALTWVMGEQGAKNLRGTSMEDVIFAGTSSRPPLGRAQVSLTIDNSDHTLDIDYTEVTISRTIFRNGGSEYAINGSVCRLLDIQELLSDTGLGQQMHVIVGQGRLDAILKADPSGHRAFIEEAAGILKHRKRKERALRKLANTESNLNRLDDLLRELHRQLGPLGRQARISRRADAIQVSVRDAQSRLYAEDAQQSMTRRATVRKELGEVRAQLATAQRELAQVKVRIEQVESVTSQSSPAIAQANQYWHDFSQTRERLLALAQLADERARSTASGIVNNMGEDSDLLYARAQELEQQATAQDRSVSDARLAYDKATEQRADSEKQLASVRQTLTELRKTAQERDSAIAKLHELIAREESAAQLAHSRVKDYTSQRETATEQRDEMQQQQLNALREQAEAISDDNGAALDTARAALAGCRDALNGLSDTQRELQSRIISLKAKADALADTLASRNASGELEHDESAHVLGRLTDFIHVEEGWEEAVAHVLGQFSSAMVVAEPSGMLHALERAREDKLGKAVMITANHASMMPESSNARHSETDDDEHAVRWLDSLVTVNPQASDSATAHDVVTAVRLLLNDTIAADGLAQAQHMVESGKAERAVTSQGEMLCRGVAAVGGSSLSQSDLALAAKRDKALAQASQLEIQEQQTAEQVAQAKLQRDEAAQAVDRESSKRTELRLRAQQAQKALQSAQQHLDSLNKQVTQFDHRIAGMQSQAQEHQLKLDDLHRALESAQQSGTAQEQWNDLEKREHELEQTLSHAREHEVEAKIAWTDASRKAESLHRQAGLLRDNAKEAAQRRAHIEALNTKRRAQAAHLQTVAQDARSVVAMVADTLQDIAAERDRLQAEASSHDEELKMLRSQRNAIEPRVTDLTAREHTLDVNRERLAMEAGQLTQKVSDELGLTLEELVQAYGPDQPVPVLDDNGNPVPINDSLDSDEIAEGEDSQAQRFQTVPYNRVEQKKRLDKARRDLAALGKINPLATEEYEALEERNKYLNDQRNDVVKSRDDLMQLIKELDSTMVTVFKSAFEDTAEAFQQVFATLFPGGTGRLRLENPDDLLTTGVLVEASPAGKRVKQLSLLSGGERSLTALALLFAIFTARPSPFYVMDEVEAALDDVNLTRLIHALNELREHAQLIIITHQQRTMSIADALYGVTMRADGVTAVISQKLADRGK